jgi:hypothetical protein
MEDCSCSSRQLLFQCVPGVGGTGCEADLLPQISAQVRNAWSCISTTLYVFTSWRFITLRGKFTFTLHAVLVDGKMCYLRPITRQKNQSNLLEGLLLGVHTLRFPPVPPVPFDSAADATPFLLGYELWGCSADCKRLIIVRNVYSF